MCGSFLSPEAVAHLDWLGVLQKVREQAVEIKHSTVTFGDKIFSVPVGERGRGAIGVPRKELEEILLAEVLRLNVNVRMGERYSPEEKTLTIMATGRSSPLPSSPNVSIGDLSQGSLWRENNRGSRLKISGATNDWYGWNATYENVQQAPGEMALHFYPGGYVGVLTFADGKANVCGLVHRRGHQALSWQSVVQEALAHSSQFQKQMKNALRASEWRGVGPLPFSTGYRGDVSDNFLLAGDAAAVGDPFMGEGNGRALGAGPMLFQTLNETAPEDFRNIYSVYRRLWDMSYNTRFQMGRLMRIGMEHPALFALFAKTTLRSPWLVRRATPYFHSGFLVKAQAL